MLLIGGAEEWATIQWERSTCKIFYEHVVRKGGDRRGSSDHLRREMISSDYVERSGGGYKTTRFGEEKQPF
jgi:hypothetical protein